MPQRNRRCDQCEWWEDNLERPGEGFCNRFPPTMIPLRDRGKTCLTSVLEDDWCGEFRPIEDE